MSHDLQSLNFKKLLESIINDKILKLLAMSMDTKLYPDWINPIHEGVPYA